MFCPRCNENVTPVDGNCPGCGRVFRTQTVEKNLGLTNEERQNLVKMAQEDQNSSHPSWMPRLEELEEDIASVPTTPVPWAELKNAEKELRSLPIRKSSATPAKSGPAPLLILAGAATAMMCLGVLAVKMAGGPQQTAVASPSPVVASPSESRSPALTKAGFLQAVEGVKPGKEPETVAMCERGLKEFDGQLTGPEQKKVRQRLQESQRVLAASELQEARAALARQDWNRAFSAAESACALNRAGKGPSQLDKQAKEILSSVQSKVAAKRPLTEATPQPGSGDPAETVAEMPSLDDGSSVPTARSVQKRGGSGAPAPQAVQLPTANKPNASGAPRPRPIVSQPAAKLGDQGVLPTYQTRSQYH